MGESSLTKDPAVFSEGRAFCPYCGKDQTVISVEESNGSISYSLMCDHLVKLILITNGTTSVWAVRLPAVKLAENIDGGKLLAS